MKQTKIDWCDSTINPVVGCGNGCPYCYARKLNQRFNFVPHFEEPQFFPERLKQLKSKTPKAIFMDSMSDVCWWKREWGAKVYEAMHDNPQHAYIFLTKIWRWPSGLPEIWSSRDWRRDKNIFLGKSINYDGQFNVMEHYDFLSIEPILEPINLRALEHSLYTKAVIIGAETGNRKGKVIPKKEWIQSIVEQCDKAHVKVFMKESLRYLMGDEFRQDKLPWYEYIERMQKK